MSAGWFPLQFDLCVRHGITGAAPIAHVRITACPSAVMDCGLGQRPRPPGTRVSCDLLNHHPVMMSTRCPLHHSLWLLINYIDG